MRERLLVVGNLAKDVFNGEEKYGGSAANLALAANGLGARVGIMSVLGKDKFSSQYRIFLEQNGIDLSLTPDTLEQLPVCEVISRQNMISSSIWHDNDCHKAMSDMGVDEGQVRNYDILHLVSCPPSLARKLASLQIELSYEPGPMLIEDKSYFDKLVARLSALIFLNKEEHQSVLDYLGSISFDEKHYEKLLALVVTLGEVGSLVYQKRQKEIETLIIPPPVIIKEIVDPTGAGDNFKAGFLVGYMRERPISECVCIGAEMGVACVQQKGGILPRDVVERIRRKYKL